MSALGPQVALERQLPQTRIGPPHGEHELVRRDHIIQRLEAGIGAPLAVVTGPPGSGKTCLLRAWVDSRPDRPVAWVSLEHQDSDRRRFWRTLIGAMEAAGDRELATELRALPLDDEDFLTALVNTLGAAGPATIVLDDFHELHGSPVTDEIDALLRHPPAGLHLILASRADPLLSLQRLRMSEQLFELRNADLMFSEAEAATLFSLAGIELTEEQLGTIVRETEGWVGGLRLAALALSGPTTHEQVADFIRSFAGDDHAVADYLIEQAISSQAEDVRDFMLRTSVVDVITPDLANALTDRSDGATMLEQLAHDNVFITAEGTRGDRFHYHRMFRELLRAQLHHRAPELERLGHRHAAQWYAREKHHALATRHALAARDTKLAAEQISRGWLKMWVSNDLQDLTPLIAQMREADVVRDPELAMASAVVLYQSGRTHEARSFFELGEQGASRVRPDRRAYWLLSRTVAQIKDASTRADFETVAAGAEKLLAGVGAEVSELNTGDRRSFALIRLGFARIWAARPDAARVLFEEALALSLQGSRSYLLFGAKSGLAVCHVSRCELREAQALGHEALTLADANGWGERSQSGYVRYVLAVAAALQGRRAEAVRHLQVLTRDCSPDPWLALAARVLSARIVSRDGDPELARVELQSLQLESAAHRTPAAWLDGLWSALAETLCTLGDGDGAAAAVVNLQSGSSLEPELFRARLALAGGEPEVIVVEDPMQAGIAPGSIPQAVELLALGAVAHLRRGDDTAALTFCECALARAEPNGLVDPFLAIGRPIRALLLRRIRAGTAHRALAGSIVEQLASDLTTHSREARALLLEPLSARELTVLRYLPATLSRAEIASEMFVSVNTVKTHVKGIYRKLDVDNRADCVRRARALGLV